MVPAYSRPKHEVLLRNMKKAGEISERSPFNKIVHKGESDFGMISSGSAYNYAVEAANLIGLDTDILKLGMTHPLPEKLIGKFLISHQKIIIVEELEPYLEMQVKAIAKDYAPNVEVFGKTKTTYLPREGELSTRRVATALTEITHTKLPIDFNGIDEKYAKAVENLPSRPPILCAGCPHRASFYVIRRVAGDGALYATDIGCYALGITPPLSVGDIMICMGASVGVSEGIWKATGRDSLAIIGDSTFLHAGIPGLINAVYNNHKIVIAVLDNMTTAMTGHQPHPGTGITGMGGTSERVDIAKVARGCGVRFVRVVDPFKTKEATKLLKEALMHEGPSVLVFRAPCALADVREKKRRNVQVVSSKVSEKCTNCMACIKLLGCPALILDKGRVCIDDNLCTSCGLCASVCPYAAIEQVT
jgi:indolepyruvate ferredoxin oxidoreductase alpha subunit